MKHLFTFCLIIAHCVLLAQTYVEEEVSLGDLKGTISIPSKKTKSAVLIISGSGPTDRDGNSALGYVNNSLKMVAQKIVEEGIVVLRFDKRGIAASKAAVTDPLALRFDHFVLDTKMWLDFLWDSGYKNLIIAGHSQGSLVGILAAQNNEKVKGFISLSGLADDAGKAIIEQLAKQAPVLIEEAQVTLDSLYAGHTVNKVNPILNSIFGPHIQDFLKSYINYKPKVEIAKLSIPVLIINGTTDLQIGVDQAETLNDAYPNAKLLIVDGMNHILKNAPADMAANLATYSDPDLPLSEGFMDDIILFIKSI